MPDAPLPYLAPGTQVRITQVDPYGMTGREPHPPTRSLKEVNAPTPREYMQHSSPCNGKTGYVVQYNGWNTLDGRMCVRDRDRPARWYTEGADVDHGVPLHSADDCAIAERNFNHAPNYEPGNDDSQSAHFYLVVIPDMGVYEFVDYELAIP